jgi:hypothetical protein
MRKILEPILFLISFFNLLGLLVMIPVAMLPQPELRSAAASCDF